MPAAAHASAISGTGSTEAARGRPDRRHDRAGVAELEQVGPQAEALVGRNRAHLELEDSRRLGRGRVRVLGADDDPPAGRRLARGDERGQRPDRGGVLDVPVELRRQAEQLPQPVQRHLLELLQHRRGAPEDADLVEGGDQQLGEDARLGARGREVGEVARALPVGDARHEHVVEVAEHGGERLRPVGRCGRQPRPDLAGLDLRQHGQLADPLEVVGDPVERRAAVLTKAQRALPRSGAEPLRADLLCELPRLREQLARLVRPALLRGDLAEREQTGRDARQEALRAPQLDRLLEARPGLAVASGVVVREREVPDGVGHRDRVAQLARERVRALERRPRGVVIAAHDLVHEPDPEERLRLERAVAGAARELERALELLQLARILVAALGQKARVDACARARARAAPRPGRAPRRRGDGRPRCRRRAPAR